MQNYVVYSPLYLLIYLFNSVPVLLEVQMFFFALKTKPFADSRSISALHILKIVAGKGDDNDYEIRSIRV